jgi:hypothetical protein
VQLLTEIMSAESTTTSQSPDGDVDGGVEESKSSDEARQRSRRRV